MSLAKGMVAAAAVLAAAATMSACSQPSASSQGGPLGQSQEAGEVIVCTNQPLPADHLFLLGGQALVNSSDAGIRFEDVKLIEPQGLALQAAYAIPITLASDGATIYPGTGIYQKEAEPNFIAAPSWEDRKNLRGYTLAAQTEVGLAVSIAYVPGSPGRAVGVSVEYLQGENRFRKDYLTTIKLSGGSCAAQN